MNVLGMRACKRVHDKLSCIHVYKFDVMVTENEVRIISVLLLPAIFV